MAIDTLRVASAGYLKLSPLSVSVDGYLTTGATPPPPPPLSEPGQSKSILTGVSDEAGAYWARRIKEDDEELIYLLKAFLECLN